MAEAKKKVKQNKTGSKKISAQKSGSSKGSSTAAKSSTTRKKSSASKKSTVQKNNTARTNSSVKKKSTSGTNGTQKSVSAKPSAAKAKRSRKTSKSPVFKVILGLCIAAVIVLAAIYGNNYYKTMVHYQAHFFPGTYINGTDCSEMTPEEAKNTIQTRLNGYSFTFTDHEDRSATVYAQDIDVTYTDDGEVEEILKKQDSLRWAFRDENEAHYSVTSGYTYNEEKLYDWIDALPCLNDGVAPTDAYEYFGEDGYWHIEPETYGDLLETPLVESIIVNAVNQAQTEADLEETDCFVKPGVYADDEYLTASVTEKNDAIDAAIARAARIDEITNVSLTFNSYIDKAYLDEELLRGMIVDDENGDPVIDEEQVKEWVYNWAEERDLDKDRNLFVTHGGRLMNVGYGVMGGWLLDVEATARRAYEAILNQESGVLFPVTTDAEGNPQSEETYVEINIMKQKMWFYLDGEELVETPVVTGDVLKGRDTPSNGIWYIYYKTTNYTMHGPRMSNGQYEYETFVNYWMPFNDQIGIHDMTARDAFGGEIYKGNGSHGCVNTPLENVEVIYKNAPIGTRVVVHS